MQHQHRLVIQLTVHLITPLSIFTLILGYADQFRYGNGVEVTESLVNS